MKKTKQLSACLALMAFSLGTAQADYALNLVKGATKISHDVYSLHMLILWICVFRHYRIWYDVLFNLPSS